MPEPKIHPVKAFLVNIARKLLPMHLLEKYSAWRHPESNVSFAENTTEETFQQIYKRNLWKGKASVSGTGSDQDQTSTIVAEISALLQSLKPASVLDIPCGDFNWMQKVNLTGIHYIGADIVADLIKQNAVNYKNSENIEFRKLDLMQDPLPKCDIILNRDCLVHLSYAGIYASLLNMKASGSKYLLTTTFPEHKINHDIITGDWRTLNLEEAPFSFPPPFQLINENCTEDNGAYTDKSLGLWLLSEIQLPQLP